MKTDYETMIETFKNIGVKFEECEERQLQTAHPIEGAAKYISVMIAHYHFTSEGRTKSLLLFTP